MNQSAAQGAAKHEPKSCPQRIVTQLHPQPLVVSRRVV
jgi:hypothetical protein